MGIGEQNREHIQWIASWIPDKPRAMRLSQVLEQSIIVCMVYTPYTIICFKDSAGKLA